MSDWEVTEFVVNLSSVEQPSSQAEKWYREYVWGERLELRNKIQIEDLIIFLCLNFWSYVLYKSADTQKC